MGFEQLGALIDAPAKSRFRLIKLLAHVDVLSALARKHKNYRPLSGFLKSIEEPVYVAVFNGRSSFVCIATDDHASITEHAPSQLQRVSDIGEFLFGMLVQMVQEICRRGIQSRRS